MPPVEQQLYEKNYLTEVIARIDFTLQEGTTLQPSKNLVDIIAKIFPVISPNEKNIRTVQLSGDEPSQSDVSFTDWHYLSKDHKNQIAIVHEIPLITTKYAIYASFKNYTRFSPFIDIFSQAYTKLFSDYADATITRVGLRYMNIISLDYRKKSNPLDWPRFINRKLIQNLDFYSKDTAVSKAISEMIVKHENNDVRFKFGIDNPDFPAKIKKKRFLLDYDAYSNSYVSINDLINTYKTFNEQIYDLFERSITPHLREKMNAN